MAGRDPAIHSSPACRWDRPQDVDARIRSGQGVGSGPPPLATYQNPAAGRDPAIHVPPQVGGRRKTWMPGSGPGKGWKGGSHPLNIRRPDLAPRQVDARRINPPLRRGVARSCNSLVSALSSAPRLRDQDDQGGRLHAPYAYCNFRSIERRIPKQVCPASDAGLLPFSVRPGCS